MRKVILALAFVFCCLPTTVWAQTVGCDTGLLKDPKAWFFDHIARKEGQDAADWVDVLNKSGLLAGPPPGVVAGAPNYGITQQIGSGGPRGRLFLPTTAPDSNNFYTREVDILRDGTTAGSLVWMWRENASQPLYAPRQCDGGTGGGTTPPPTGNLEAQVKVLTLQIQRLQEVDDGHEVALSNLDIAFKNVNARLIYVESRLPTGCYVRFIGCTLNFPNVQVADPSALLAAPKGAKPETPKEQLERLRAAP